MFAYTKLMQAMAAAGVVSATDPYFNLTTLLLPGNGTNGAQNNTFLDSSTNNFTITRNGNTTQGTFSPFSQTGWGNFFNGSNAYLSIGSNAALAPGTGNFWVECWINLSNLPSSGTVYNVLQNDVLGVSTNDKFWFGVINSSGTYRLQLGRHGTSDASYVNWTPSIGVWYHIAYGRSSGTSYLFIDGVSQTVTGSLSGISFGQNGAVIGAISTPYYFSGYISNLRYIVGAVLYTSTFTPSTTPLTTTSQGASSSQVEILTCQDNRFVDNSSNAFAITVNGTPSVQAFSPFAPTAAYSAATNGGSGYFDGTGDYLTTPSSANLAMGSGDVTAECWFYPFTSGNQQWLFDFRTSGSESTTTLYAYISETNSIMYTGFGGFGDQASGTPIKNAWNHMAIVRSGSGSNNVAVFLNGVRTLQLTDTTNLSTSTSVYVGRRYSATAGQHMAGYIAATRMVKGTAVYSPSASTLTVPTAPPTPITNTQLLLNFTNAGIIDATGKNDLETVGNAQISTTQSKFGGSSMYFDGTGDALTTYAPWCAMGSSDLTVECWVYITAQPTSEQGLVSTFQATGGTTGFLLGFIPSNPYIQFTIGNGTVVNPQVVASSSISLNTWTHVAGVRRNGTISLYINGVSVGTPVSATGSLDRTLLGIGSAYPSTISNNLNGYLDEVRITRGYARYTANFTPPAAAFPLQ